MSYYSNKQNIVDSQLERTDPTPNIHELFRKFNERFFWNKLNMVEVSWSTSRMTTCAGVCSFQPRTRYCRIRLSAPLLSLRPRKDLVETLLHEMIHAFLFMTNNNRDRDDHGPEFHKHMHRINNEAGTQISVYHTFHDEVNLFKTHVWRCNGPCQKLPPFYGFVRRACNRAPGKNDRWWNMHRMKCSGNFEKIKEPADYKNKKAKKKETKGPLSNFISKSGKNDCDKFKEPIKAGTSHSRIKTPPKKTENDTDHVRQIWANKYPTGKRKSDEPIMTDKKTIVQCDDCDELLSKEEMKSHQTNCPARSNSCPKSDEPIMTDKKTIVQCDDCDELLSKEEMKSHQTNCPARSNSCPVCGAPVQKGHLEEHLNNCLEDSMTEDFMNLSQSDDVVIVPTDEPAKQESCPICRISVQNGKLEGHLNSCLSEDFNEVVPIDDQMVSCPICEKRVKERTINSHIDECVNLQAFREEFPI